LLQSATVVPGTQLQHAVFAFDPAPTALLPAPRASYLARGGEGAQATAAVADAAPAASSLPARQVPSAKRVSQPSRFALLTNVDRLPAVWIRNSYFGQNRARGALLKSSHVVVEDTVFDHTSAHCIQAFPDGCYWFESSGFTNWTVRNVSFLGCNAGGGAMGGLADVFVAACAPAWGPDGRPKSQGGSPVTVGQPFADLSIVNSRCVHASAGGPAPAVHHPRRPPPPQAPTLAYLCGRGGRGRTALRPRGWRAV
jgi:hypothetical protein